MWRRRRLVGGFGFGPSVASTYATSVAVDRLDRIPHEGGTYQAYDQARVQTGRATVHAGVSPAGPEGRHGMARDLRTPEPSPAPACSVNQKTEPMTGPARPAMNDEPFSARFLAALHLHYPVPKRSRHHRPLSRAWSYYCIAMLRYDYI